MATQEILASVKEVEGHPKSNYPRKEKSKDLKCENNYPVNYKIV